MGVSLPGTSGRVFKRDRWVCLSLELVGVSLGETDGCVFNWS